MIALLAIKPEFSNKILSGKKQYEFRRAIFADRNNVDFVCLYASSPEQRIVGGFTTDRAVEASPEELWERFGAKSGIADRDRFLNYFDGVDTGYAIRVSESFEFPEPIDPNSLLDDFHPPVSFRYLDADEVRALRDRISSVRGNGEEIPLPRFADD